MLHCLLTWDVRRCKAAGDRHDRGVAQVRATAHSSTYGPWPGIHYQRRAWVECWERLQCAYISPGSPLDNSFVESFTSRYREWISEQWAVHFRAEGQVVGWTESNRKYCTYRPHWGVPGTYTPWGPVPFWKQPGYPLALQQKWTSKGPTSPCLDYLLASLPYCESHGGQD